MTTVCKVWGSLVIYGEASVREPLIFILGRTDYLNTCDYLF